MVKNKKSVEYRPILLTGSHRSGTTWAANIIQLSNELSLIMEPFNDANNRYGIFNKKLDYYFPYITEKNGEQYLESVRKTLNFEFDINSGLVNIRNAKDAARFLRDYIVTIKNHYFGKRPFIKDPNALFMAEWLANNFNMDVIILIRHPAAFISSLKLLDWSFPFGSLLEQKLLIKDYLYEYEEQIIDYSRTSRDIIDQGILLWNMLHHVINVYKSRHYNWLFLRHEDLSSNPEKEFHELFRKLNIDYTPEINNRIKLYTSENNPADTTSVDVPLNSKKSIKRNTRSNITNWKRRLTSDEINRIRNGVSSISEYFYSDTDW